MREQALPVRTAAPAVLAGLMLVVYLAMRATVLRFAEGGNLPAPVTSVLFRGGQAWGSTETAFRAHPGRAYGNGSERCLGV
jgi:hypothetical protein